MPYIRKRVATPERRDSLLTLEPSGRGNSGWQPSWMAPELAASGEGGSPFTCPAHGMVGCGRSGFSRRSLG